ncbi:MAG: hypothetical protein HZC06_04860, partial [Methylocystis sp.]|nr:hypothetical protein [Methylocystis sp.]
KLREAAEIRAELKRISGQKRGDLDLDSPTRRAIAGGLGLLAMLAGAGLLMRRERKSG